MVKTNTHTLTVEAVEDVRGEKEATNSLAVGSSLNFLIALDTHTHMHRERERERERDWHLKAEIELTPPSRQIQSWE